MKRIASLIVLLAASLPARAQTTVNIAWTWTSPSAAATVAKNAAGVETSGPIWATMYSIAVPSGTAACPAFSIATWTELAPNQMALTSGAAAGSSYVQGVVEGATYCFALTEQFQAGGLSTAPVVSSPVAAVLTTPANTSMPTSPAGLTGTVQQP